MVNNNDFSEKFKLNKLSKLPMWAWYLISYVILTASNYYLICLQINDVPYILQILYGTYETGNLFFLTFIFGFFYLVILEVIIYLFSSLLMNSRVFNENFKRNDFKMIFRFFYLASMCVTGVLQIFYFIYPITLLLGTTLFGLLPRVIASMVMFYYLKKNYLDNTNTHIFIKNYFTLFLGYEAFMLVFTLIN